MSPVRFSSGATASDLIEGHLRVRGDWWVGYEADQESAGNARSEAASREAGREPGREPAAAARKWREGGFLQGARGATWRSRCGGEPVRRHLRHACPRGASSAGLRSLGRSGGAGYDPASDGRGAASTSVQ